jgi:hypothetical protein
MYPHRIRLREPWKHDDLTASEGPICFSRRFGYPGRIDADERVWLVVEELTAPATVMLNSAALGPALGTAEYDVTSLLLPRNEVVIEMPVTAGPGLPWQEVCLEVRRTAYLRDVRVWVEGGQVHTSGLVVGSAEALLEVYVVADRSVAAYTSIIALDSGQPFHLSGSVSGPVAEVRVELVQGAVVWYAQRHELAQGSGA